MHFICRPFIGKNNPSNWSQYWENEPDDFQIKSTKGHLFGLVNLSSLKEDDQNVQNLGHDLIFEINQNYFSTDPETDVSTSIKSTLQTISKNPLYKEFKIQLIILVILKETAYIASLGETNASLSRISNISLLLKDNQADSISFVSGPIERNDKIFLFTNKFSDKITWTKIKSILSDSNIKSIEENFLSLLYTLKDQENLASVLIEVKEDFDNQSVFSEESVGITENTLSESTRTGEQLKTKSKNFFSNSIDIFQKLFSRKKDQDPQVFIDQHSNHPVTKRKKIQIIVALFLLLALFVSCFFGYKKNQRIKTEDRYQELKTELEKQLNNISLVKNMNLEAAQESAKESEKIVEEMNSLLVHQDEVTQFQSQINVFLSQTGVTKDFTPDLFYDTSLITSKPNYNQLSLFQSNLYLLDSNNGRIDRINTDQKSKKNILTSKEIKNAQKIIIDNDDVYLLFENKVSLVKENSLEEKITFSDLETTFNTVDLEIWNSSLYLLDSQSNNIWKFTSNSSGFSEPQKWLKGDQELNLGPISLSIDGELWVLHQNGLIENYLSGVKDNFKLKTSPQINKANNLTVSLDEKSFMAFIDDQSVVYIYKKDGDFVAQYNLGDLKISDMVLDDNILYILASDQKIYKIKL